MRGRWGVLIVSKDKSIILQRREGEGGEAQWCSGDFYLDGEHAFKQTKHRS